MSDDFDRRLQQRLARLAAAVPSNEAAAVASISRPPIRAALAGGPLGLAAVAVVVLIAAVVGIRPPSGPRASGRPSSSPAADLATFQGENFAFRYPAGWQVISGYQHAGIHGPTVVFAVGLGGFDLGCSYTSTSVACGPDPHWTVPDNGIVVAYHVGAWLGPIAPQPSPSLAIGDQWVSVAGHPAVLSQGPRTLTWHLNGAPEYIEARWGPRYAGDAGDEVRALVASWQWFTPTAKPTEPSPTETPTVPSPPAPENTSTWTPVSLPRVSTSPAGCAGDAQLSALPDGGFVEFAHRTGTATDVYVSTDGSRWSLRGTISTTAGAVVTGPVAWDGRRYVALGCEVGGIRYGPQQNAAVWASADLRTWSQAPSQSTFGGVGWRALAAGPTGFVATGYSQLEGGSPAWYSADGLHWASVSGTRTSDADTVEATAVAFRGSEFVMVGRLNNDAAAWTSRDGRTWAIHAPLSGGSDVVLNGLVQTPSGFLSLGVGAPRVDAGSGVELPSVGAWASADGATWRPASPSATLLGADDISLVDAPGGYVATGSQGLGTGLWTSRDGLTWASVAGVDLSNATFTWVTSDGQHVLLSVAGTGISETFVSAGVER